MIFYKKKLRFLVREISGVIYLVSKGECFEINEVTNDILEFIRSKRTQKEIVDMLINSYRVDKNTAEEDVENTLHELVAVGAVERMEEKSYHIAEYAGG